jgi:tRNA modification GTPase
MSNSNETIFALSTPYGQSAIAVIRISGPECLKISKELTDLGQISPRKAYFTKLYDKKRMVLDTIVLIYFKSPNSYTGEEMLEIQCHGSISIVNKILSELSSFENSRFADPGEFSRRGYLNGKNSLIHYEGLANLISSETENQRILANKQTFGQTENICQEWRRFILDSISILDAAIDFSDENESFDVTEVSKRLSQLLEQIKLTVKYSDNLSKIDIGGKIVIFGPPNSGKSSFFNYISREERAITSNEEGTTTDLNTNVMELAGAKAVFTDTAGLRDALRSIEKKGIAKTKQAIDESSRFILVLSPDCLSENNVNVLSRTLEGIQGKRIVVIFNKNDLATFEAKKDEWVYKINALKKIKSLSISCVIDKKNIKKLIELNNFINDNLLAIDTLNNDDYFFSEKRQIDNLNEIIRHLENSINNIDELEISSDYLMKALRVLDKLYGKNDFEERLGYIFEKFCIGK